MCRSRGCGLQAEGQEAVSSCEGVMAGRDVARLTLARVEAEDLGKCSRLGRRAVHVVEVRRSNLQQRLL